MRRSFGEMGVFEAVRAGGSVVEQQVRMMSGGVRDLFWGADLAVPVRRVVLELRGAEQHKRSPVCVLLKSGAREAAGMKDV